MEILTVIKPANSYYAMGHMHHEPSATWYETKTYNVVVDGVICDAKKTGITKENMTELFYKVGGNDSFKIGLSISEVKEKISEIEKRIVVKINEHSVPTDENIKIGRRIWAREIKDSLEEALATLMTCRRYSPLERRFFAKKLIENKVISLRMLVNYTNSLMV